MENTNSYKYITTAATTAFAGETKRVILSGIQINKTTAGTITVLAGSTTIGVIAAGTLPQTLWLSERGVEIQDLKITNAAGEDTTVFYRNI
jgi:outer membrane lipoprotein-sorting protein